jgi:hypothetical protein
VQRAARHCVSLRANSFAQATGRLGTVAREKLFTLLLVTSGQAGDRGCGIYTDKITKNLKIKKMKRRTLRCQKDPSHVDFEAKKKRCRCGATLEASCTDCGEFFSYGHVSEHEKLKICRKEEPQQAVVTFGYWSSDWKLGTGKKPFEISPRGQLGDGLPDGFSQEFVGQVRVHTVTDRSMKGTEWMDAYDAVYARIACDPLFELVTVFPCWEKVESFVLKVLKHDASAMEKASRMRLLVLGNWVHQVAQAKGVLEVALDWCQKLQSFELLTGCRIFPPLDYSIAFARKELVDQMLCIACPKVRGAVSIPTLILLDDPTKAGLKAFTSQHHDDLVFKRSISGGKRHVQMINARKFSFGKGETLPWLVQPKMPEFSQSNELRLYIVNGKFLWGVSSKFQEGDAEMSLFAFGPGRKGCDEWDERAVRVAEQLVAVVGQRQPGALKFMRVDMIKSSNAKDTWLVNELEFFGNAFVHLDIVDDGYELVPTVVECVKSWMQMQV